MNRQRLLFLVVVLAVLYALMAAVPLTASAADHTTTECLLCHGSGTAQMIVGPVNRSTACKKCHLASLAGTHPYHHGGGNCASICHRTWGASLAANVPNYTDANGSFAAAESQNVPAGVLHSIHSTPRWMSRLRLDAGKCGSCHAVAACDACHNSTDPPMDYTHSDHGLYGNLPTSTPIVPWVGNVSPGVTALLTEDTMQSNASVRCGATTCHNTAGAEERVPDVMDTYVPAGSVPSGWIPASIVTSGTWAKLNGPQYTLGSEWFSNKLNARMTLTFTGQRVTLVGDKDPYRGIGEILIDGVHAADVDFYNATTIYQRPVWRSPDLGPGTHTIALISTGTKRAAARGSWVSFDAIKIEPVATDSISPDCGTCHTAEIPDEHGGLEHPQTFSFSHEITQTIISSNTWSTGYGTYNCTQCHSASLRAEHIRTTASGKAIYDSLPAPKDSCPICHPTSSLQDPLRTLETSFSTYRRTSIATAWTGTYVLTDGCSFNKCHTATDPQGDVRVRHGYFASKHTTTTAGQSPACSACHPGDLRATHDNPIPGNAKCETNGCLTCHGPGIFYTNRRCDGCHAMGSYSSVTTTGHPIKDANAHTATSFTSAGQGGRADQTDGGYECTACHTSQLIAAHANPGTGSAVTCSSGGVNGNGCHMDATFNSINVAGSGWASGKCSECHDYAAKRTHDDTVTAHSVTANGCAGSGPSCHNSTDLWKLHALNWNFTGAPKYQNCANTGCHVAGQVNKRPTLASKTNSCGSTSPNTGCHTGFGTGHASDFGHTFSSTSYYNGTSETGCTNQLGCHNQTSSETTNFAPAYHPNDGACSTGGCHSSASKAAFSGILPTECQECHTTGAYTGAVGRATLTAAPASGGHFSEATHTAGGMTAAVSAGGSASATCDQCHSATIGTGPNGLPKQHSTMNSSHYGSALSCGECHGDTWARGYAEVIANWTNNTCADCHSVTSWMPLDHASTVGAVAEVGSTCGATGAGCHNTTDLHALHKDASGGCSLTGCHVYTQQANMPTAKGCGGATSCHPGYTNSSHGTTTGDETLHTANATYMTTTLTSGTASAACSACHSSTLNLAHKEASTTSNLGSGHTAWSSTAQASCLDCHNATTAPVTAAPTVVKTNWSSGSDKCSDCHATYHNTLSAHTGTSSLGCGATGNGCHTTYNLLTLHGQTKTNGCQVTGCHDSKDKSMAAAPKNCENAACHPGYTLSSHGPVANGNETSTHETTLTGFNTKIGGTTYDTGGNNTCAACHSRGMELSHRETSVTSSLKSGATAWNATAQPICQDCHNTQSAYASATAVTKAGWTQRTCQQCHGSALGTDYHDRYTSVAHTASVGTTSGTDGCIDGGCHVHGVTGDVRLVHNRTGFGCTAKGTDTQGWSGACHQLDKQMPVGGTLSCGAGGTGTIRCHVNHTETNHGSAGKHQFSSASDYSVANETGCANSSDGCHGSETTYAYFNNSAYHKTMASTCLSSLCHTDAAGKAAHTGGATPGSEQCVDCHVVGSGYTGIRARSKLTSSPANGGHYSETTHTASSPASTTAINAGGSASATCKDCHNESIGTAWGKGLMNQHAGITPTATSTYGTTVGCAECHGDTGSHGMNEVLANWTNNACGDCHNATSKSTFDHASSVPSIDDTMPTSCGTTGINCHTTKDIHALHKNSSGGCSLTDDGGAKCHDYSKQAYYATARSCGTGGTCHKNYNLNTKFNTHTKSAETSNHAPTSGNTAQSSATWLGNACDTCHIVTAAQGGLVSYEHTSTYSLQSISTTNTCINCHNNTNSTTAVANGWADRNSTSACAACHTGGMAVHADANSTAHSDVVSNGCSGSGIGCHNSNDLSKVGALTTVNNNIHTTCLRCHDRTASGGNKAYNPNLDTCGGASGECHGGSTYDSSSFTHNGSFGAGLADGEDLDHHTDTVMSGTVGSGPNNTCSSCHSATLATSHSNTMTGWSNTCTGCHNSTLAVSVSAVQVKTGWTNNDCLDCHEAGASGTKIPNQHSRFLTATHSGTPTGANNCGSTGGACHLSGTSLELSDIHATTSAGCTVQGGTSATSCHALNKPMTTIGKTCGPGGDCHSGATYVDGGHGFTLASHTTSDTNSWKNCGRCHLGQRDDYTRGGLATDTYTFTGNLIVDTTTNTVDIHRNASRGGNGCDTCHDAGSRVYALVESARASSTVNGSNCDYCHVDHRVEYTDGAPFTTKATSTGTLADTVNVDFHGMKLADISFKLATSSHDTSAHARVEIGPVGSAYVTTYAVTPAQDPLRKKFRFEISVDGTSWGTQPVRLYVWSGSSDTTAYAESFEIDVARGNMVEMHTADTEGFTCGFGDCHDPNVAMMHKDYEIPGAFTNTYSFPPTATPNKTNNTTVQSGTTANTFTKVKSITLSLKDVDKMRMRLNLYTSSATLTQLAWEVRQGTTVIARGGRASNSTNQYWWDYADGGVDPTGTALAPIDTSSYTGNTTFDLYLRSGSTTRRAKNNIWQFWYGTRIYEDSTPTNSCDLCHLNDFRRDNYGAVQSNDTSLGSGEPKLATFTPQCDGCHPQWKTGHPQFAHRADYRSNTCLLGCHQYEPSIRGVDKGDEMYDLTKRHMWGDNTKAGITYTASSTALSETFGTVSGWSPVNTWNRSNTTYVSASTTMLAGTSASAYIRVPGSRQEYSLASPAIDLAAWRGATLKFNYLFHGSDASDYLICEYSTTSDAAGFTQLWRTSADQLTASASPTMTVPGDGNVWIRFRASFDVNSGANAEYAVIDDVVIRNAGRTLPGTMEGGCAVGPTGACHNQGFATTAQCADCHAQVDNHNVVHDLSVITTAGGTGQRESGVATGFAFGACIGTCHVNDLHFTHGVALQETEPRPYRGAGETTDSYMSCATCHGSGNSTIKATANSTATPIKDGTLMCADCHTGVTGMASAVHTTGSVGATRTGSPLMGANIINQYNNNLSVSGHLVPPYDNPYSMYKYFNTTAWYTTSGTGRSMMQFDNHNAAPGAAAAAALLRASTADGVALENGSSSLSTSTVVACADCHGHTAAELEGPQAAAFEVSYYSGDTTYTTKWRAAMWVTGPNAPTTLICYRCHDLSKSKATTSLHLSRSSHYGTSTECINCHIAVPHAWKRPKLLVSTTKDAGTAYVYLPGTSTGSSLKGWNATSGGKASTIMANGGSCSSAGCTTHSGTSNIP